MEIQLKQTQQQPTLPPPKTPPSSLQPTPPPNKLVKSRLKANTITRTQIPTKTTALKNHSPLPFPLCPPYKHIRTTTTTTTTTRRTTIHCSCCSDNEEISHLPFSFWALRNTDSCGTDEQ